MAGPLCVVESSQAMCRGELGRGGEGPMGETGGATAVGQATLYKAGVGTFQGRLQSPEGGCGGCHEPSADISFFHPTFSRSGPAEP